MNRQTWYQGEQVQSAVLMQQERDDAKALGMYIAESFGDTNARFYGFAATPGSGLTVNLAPGSLYQNLATDATVWGTLAADTDAITYRHYVNATTNLTGFAAPATSGQSINYLIEWQLTVADAANTNVPFNNNGATTYVSKSPSRGTVPAFQVKAGTAAATGSQTTPSADAGWQPMYVVTVDYGETSLTSDDIVLHSNAREFYGFVEINPTGLTPVYLSPASQQVGFININGAITAGGNIATTGNLTLTNGTISATGTGSSSLGGPLGVAGTVTITGSTNGIVAPNSTIGGATAQTGYKLNFLGQAYGDFLNLTGLVNTNGNANASIVIAGAVAYSGSHAGTDADPYPLSQLNVAMFGGKLPGDYALASGNYVLLSSTPNPAAQSGHVAITGNMTAAQLVASVAQGTAPFIVTSTTQVANLNAQYLAGFVPGNSNGQISLNNGTMNTNLVAQYLGDTSHPMSAFAPAGNYAVVSAAGATVNTGGVSVTQGFYVTGGTASQQTQLFYSATNGWGVNSGNGVSILESATPIVLEAPSVLTTGSLSVGENGTKSVTAQDYVANGVMRGGMGCVYTVTYSSSTSYPTPGNGQAFGTWQSYDGSFTIAADDVSASPFYFGYRTKLTLSSAITVTINAMGVQGNDFVRGTTGGGKVYLDGNPISGIIGAFFNGVTFTIPAGTHTVDIIYMPTSLINEYGNTEGDLGQRVPWGGSLSVFGWLPLDVNGRIDSRITAIAPG